MSAWERVLKLWAKSYRESLDTRVQDLIAMAHCDLWYGPHTAETFQEEDPTRETIYPGFSAAVGEIARALPSTLWIDTGTEDCLESEPSLVETCYECAAEEGCEDCNVCGGRGELDAYLEDIVEVGRKDIVRAVVGKELAEYV